MAGIIDATDAIISRFMDQWLADSPTVVGVIPPAVVAVAPTVVTQATADMSPHPRDTGLPWARITVLHATGRATALGNRRFEKTGTVIVEVYVPFVDGSALTTAQRLAEVAKKRV